MSIFLSPNEAPDEILVAGLDRELRASSGLEEAGALFRVLEGRATGHALIERLRRGGTRLVVLGPWIPDLTLPETVRRIRGNAVTRQVSILAVADRRGHPAVHGVNAVLLEPEPDVMVGWVNKLRSVAPRVELQVDVEGHALGARGIRLKPFRGITRNISPAGLLVSSLSRLQVGSDVELGLDLPVAEGIFRVLGRVVRDDPRVAPPARGYGIEFLCIPPATETALAAVAGDGLVPGAPLETFRCGPWTCTIHGPVPVPGGWEVEIRRRSFTEPNERRFIRLTGATTDEALREARLLLRRRFLSGNDTLPPIALRAG